MIKVTVESTPVLSLSAEVQADLEQFDSWFQQRGNDPLVGSEVSILKTYLFYKCVAEKEKPPL